MGTPVPLPDPSAGMRTLSLDPTPSRQVGFGEGSGSPGPEGVSGGVRSDSLLDRSMGAEGNSEAILQEGSGVSDEQPANSWTYPPTAASSSATDSWSDPAPVPEQLPNLPPPGKPPAVGAPQSGLAAAALEPALEDLWEGGTGGNGDGGDAEPGSSEPTSAPASAHALLLNQLTCPLSKVSYGSEPRFCIKTSGSRLPSIPPYKRLCTKIESC